MISHDLLNNETVQVFTLLQNVISIYNTDKKPVVHITIGSVTSRTVDGMITGHH